jgi:hypothetical protein
MPACVRGEREEARGREGVKYSQIQHTDMHRKYS